MRAPSSILVGIFVGIFVAAPLGCGGGAGGGSTGAGGGSSAAGGSPGSNAGAGGATAGGAAGGGTGGATVDAASPASDAGVAHDAAMIDTAVDTARADASGPDGNARDATTPPPVDARADVGVGVDAGATTCNRAGAATAQTPTRLRDRRFDRVALHGGSLSAHGLGAAVPGLSSRRPARRSSGQGAVGSQLEELLRRGRLDSGRRRSARG